MSMYSAEEVNARIDSFHGHPLTVAERAELFCMAREYAALLREREQVEKAMSTMTLEQVRDELRVPLGILGAFTLRHND